MEPAEYPTHHATHIFSGIAKSAEALALAELLVTKNAIVHVAASDREMENLAAALAFFAPDAEVLQFPAWDAMPYDRASPNAAIMAERMRVLSGLLRSRRTDDGLRMTEKDNSSVYRHPSSVILLTTANAITQRLPPKNMMRGITMTLSTGENYSRDALVEFLVKQGYRRSGKAMEPGEFALRGGIMDFVPPGMTNGLRLDFFGDTIESIKPYDPFTQLTQGAIQSVSLYPVSEVMLNEETLTRFRERYREQFGAIAKDDPLYESISQGTHYPGMEHWLPLFYEDTATLFDYCEGAFITLGGETQAALDERFETIADYYDARINASSINKKNSFASSAVYHPLPPDELFLMQAGWELKLSQTEHAAFSPLASTTSKFRALLALPATSPFDQLRERVNSAGKATLLACYTTGSRERLQTLLAEHEFHAVRIDSWDSLPHRGRARVGAGLLSGNNLTTEQKCPPPNLPPTGGGIVYLALLPLETGFETEKVLILSEQDVLGERIMRTKKSKKKSDVFMQEAANFAEGELVVHKEHGIGKFEGLVTLEVSGAAHDCLKLIYDGGDKLFLPVENIDMVTRFGLDEEGAKLDKLGGASWQSRKAKLKEKILMSAEALLKTAAQRTLRTGAVMETEAGTYDDFCSRFPYMETDDQARAISDVLEDLGKGRPMDRLICGDVGFGKTEVALRAAFVVTNAAVDGGRMTDDEINPSSAVRHPSANQRYQVALIVPTTLLARQHFSNFKKRFDGFPVEVRQLSRIVPARQQAETHELIKEGKVDIVVGTHALLSKNVQFKNLGLLIVDEEQHFGVAQKEKLKELKSDIHVLTLSATPIPRTLQMALTGVRDLSLITTPPVDRLAIRSFVMPFDPVVVREAILREMHRGGKSFVVTPRIKNIGEVKAQLAEIVPEAKVVVAHGQMPASQLDEVMNDFYDGKYDVLLATAIIESGLDIELANTMIIHNAHLLGLSQLYQLRGRVGRGKTRAYAYFLLPHHRLLSKNATRRLEVMQTLDTLGAGFTLASHDMDIRGFGNLVGEEQSGHIREVGIELYQQMLEEAVASLRKTDDGLRMTEKSDSSSSVMRPPSTDWSPQINLGLPVLIPEIYVDDLQLRLGLYRRAASLASEEEINSFAAELVDRFGALPSETTSLIDTLNIKLLCKQAGIDRMDIGPKGAVLSFKNNVFANPEALLAHVYRHPRTLKVRPDQKLVFMHEWKKPEDTIPTMKRLVGEVVGLAGI